jgi:hypothetical protein
MVNTKTAFNGATATPGGVFRALLWRPFAFFFGALFRPLMAALGAAAHLAAWAIYLPMHFARRIPILSRLIERFTHVHDPVDHLEREAASLSKGKGLTEAEQLLIRGERQAYAERIASPARHPTLYMDVPEDLRRSVVQDGRMVNGEAPATALAGATIKPAFVARAWFSSVETGIRAGYLTLLVAAGVAMYLVHLNDQGYNAESFVRSAAESTSSAVRGAVDRALEEPKLTRELVIGKYIDAWNDQDIDQLIERAQAIKTAKEAASAGDLTPAGIAASHADVWSDADSKALRDKIVVPDKSGKFGAMAHMYAERLTTGVVMFALLMTAAVLLALAVARLIFIGRLRFTVHGAADAAVDPLRKAWREALQRWRWRLADREVETESYNDQVRFATRIDRSPLIDLGQSLGMLEFRGHLLAPQQGQPVRMSILDLLQHVKVFGGTGEGKSRNFYVPLVRQLLKFRAEGYPIAIYATDDKGAIGADILEAAQAARVPPEDILVIGTGPNDWRVDLLAGLQPVEFADIVKSVARQAGGESADDFWPEMASDLLLNVAVVLQAAEVTDAGIDWVAKNKKRMYSVRNILKTASHDTEIMSALRIIEGAWHNKDDQYHRIADFDTNALDAATRYLVDNWLTMVDATKDGIRANARKALRMFDFKDEIAQGFGDGSGDNIIPASALLSNKIKIVNVSQIEHGSAGRLVAIMLKTLLFKQARARELQDPLAAKQRMRWWFDPKPSHSEDLEKFSLNVFLADEYQGLVTATPGGGAGIDDGTAWNVLRSAGVAGVLISQSVSAYKNAVGDKAADNMRSNWRTLIMLRTEDVQTIEEAKKLAGKTMRFNSMDWNHLESTVAVRREIGTNSDAPTPATWNDELDKLPVFFTPAHFEPFDFPGYDNAYEVDERFIPEAKSGPNGNGYEQLQALQAAAWRQEDRSAAILQAGSSEEDAVRDEDLMQMGRGRALVFVQRAGSTRVDIIKLLNN